MPSHYENLDNGGGMPPDQRGRNIIAAGLGGAGTTLEDIRRHGRSAERGEPAKKYRGPAVPISMSADLREQMRADDVAATKRSQARSGTEGQIIAAGMGPDAKAKRKPRRVRSSTPPRKNIPRQ